jgi:hypothetical protein
MGAYIRFEIQIPKVIPDDLKSWKQQIYIAVDATYNDGFAHTPDQHLLFCDISTFQPDIKLFAMRPCPDPNGTLKGLIGVDLYPSTQYEQQQ